ncbi:hypothetical protein T03_1923 [Trichinella britovi]|uniref:Uncharacterized protein n=1 Tax=Trichinella britovi TaxID=45882 RepID=A0A0V0Z592_TRIBR|nr:hypothetical protein T03_1923 [Trichinella britovi]
MRGSCLAGGGIACQLIENFIYRPRMPCNQPLQFIQLLFMVECMGIYSAALCMLTGPDDLCGIKVSTELASATSRSLNWKRNCKLMILHNNNNVI